MTPRGTRTGRWWLLLVPPLAAAALTFAALAYSSGGFSSAPELGPVVAIGFVAWGLAPALGMTALVLVTLLRGWRGRVALLVGGLALLGFMVWSMGAIVTSDSSTSALGFVFFPLYAWPIVLATGVVVLVLTLRDRTPDRLTPRP